VLDDKGAIKCINDKIHLFEANIRHADSVTNLKESDYTTQGKEFYMPLNTPIGTMGNLIVKSP
jgi:hypothetical protein